MIQLSAQTDPPFKFFAIGCMKQMSENVVHFFDLYFMPEYIRANFDWLPANSVEEAEDLREEDTSSNPPGATAHKQKWFWF